MSNYGYGNADKNNKNNLKSTNKKEEEKKQKMRKRRDYFDGGDEFDADLNDDFEEKEQALEFEKVLHCVLHWSCLNIVCNR